VGLLDFFRGKQSNQDKADVSISETNFATWRDPVVAPPTEEWERRLNNYSEKCARQLKESGVPLFQSQWPKGGKGNYRDAFWLIACNVEVAERVWVAHPLFGTKNSDAGYPPPLQKGEFFGWFHGESLLLTSSGVLCVADASGCLIRNGGGVDNRMMDIGFNDIRRPLISFKSEDWGWSNRGMWRRNPKSDYSSQGLKFYINGIRFEEKRHRTKPYAEDGRDTSAALTNFVKTNGQIRWPRGFVSFHYN